MRDIKILKVSKIIYYVEILNLNHQEKMGNSSEQGMNHINSNKVNSGVECGKFDFCSFDASDISRFDLYEVK
jgi:hypothetical protein